MPDMKKKSLVFLLSKAGKAFLSRREFGRHNTEELSMKNHALCPQFFSRLQEACLTDILCVISIIYVNYLDYLPLFILLILKIE